jgi:hypothetical protein
VGKDVGTESAAELMPVIAELQAAGIKSALDIANELNRRGVRASGRTRDGGWDSLEVEHLLRRLADSVRAAKRAANLAAAVAKRAATRASNLAAAHYAHELELIAREQAELKAEAQRRGIDINTLIAFPEPEHIAPAPKPEPVATAPAPKAWPPRSA